LSLPVEQIDIIEVVPLEASTDERTLGPSTSIVNANPTNPPNAFQVDVPTPNPSTLFPTETPPVSPSEAPVVGMTTLAPTGPAEEAPTSAPVVQE
jgi:hypothetical protein